MTWGIVPTTLGPHVLYLSWTNKISHTQQPDGSNGNNHHSDHHLRPNRNFGVSGVCRVEVHCIVVVAAPW